MIHALSGFILDFAGLALLLAACLVALRVPAVQQGAREAARRIEVRAGARMTVSNAAPGMAGAWPRGARGSDASSSVV